MKLYTFVLILLGLCSFLCKCEWTCQGNPSNEAKLASLLHKISKDCNSSLNGTLTREKELNHILFRFMDGLFRAKSYFFNTSTKEEDVKIGPFFLGLLASNHTLSFVPPLYGFKLITRWLNFAATPSLNRIFPPFLGSRRDFEFHQDFCTSSYSPLFKEIANSILRQPIARNKAILYAHSSFPMIRYFDPELYEWYNVFLPMISKMRLSRLWEMFQPFERIYEEQRMGSYSLMGLHLPCEEKTPLFDESISFLFPSYDYQKEGRDLPICNYTTEMFDYESFEKIFELQQKDPKFVKLLKRLKNRTTSISLTNENVEDEQLKFYRKEYPKVIKFLDIYKGFDLEEVIQGNYFYGYPDRHIDSFF